MRTRSICSLAPLSRCRGRRMASYSTEEFLGDGALKPIIPKLVAGGWDDVPALKMMNSQDMDRLNLSHHQKNALQIRTYLHDRSLMEYAERVEASRKALPELLTMSASVLGFEHGMKRSHIARFLDCSCKVTRIDCRNDPSSSSKVENMGSRVRKSMKYDASMLEQSMESKVQEGYVFRGIVAAEPAEPRLCGCVQPPPVVTDVAAYSTVENISVQMLTQECKVGMGRFVGGEVHRMKASELWRDQPAVLLCLRRPGCIMCRAEAHQLYARKPLFDALGFKLVAVLHEHIESEVKDFWPRFWGGSVVVDENKEFFRALGGGVLLRDNFITGFLLNRRAIANYLRAKRASGMSHNFNGEGEIKGGLLIIRKGNAGIAYQFIERNFGDWAPIPEVIEICKRIQKLKAGHCED